MKERRLADGDCFERYRMVTTRASGGKAEITGE
jgi:hypothetical protein